MSRRRSRKKRKGRFVLDTFVPTIKRCHLCNLTSFFHTAKECWSLHMALAA